MQMSRRLTTRPFFILLIVVFLILILSAGRAPSPAKHTQQNAPHSRSHVKASGPHRPPSHPPKPPPPLPPPTTPSLPPAPLFSVPPVHPPTPFVNEEVRSKADQKREGKVVGLLFLGIVGLLQVGVVSFLVFKRWQISRIQDETGVRLVS